MNEQPPGLTFPCEFPVKAMGPDDGQLPGVVWNIVTRHAPETPDGAIRTNSSRRGRFLSVTITITAHSREQLEAIYAELNAHKGVLATL